MPAPKITDHALVRFLERAGGMDVEQLRADLSASLERANMAARALSQSDFLIRVDGLLYVVRGENVVTVIDDSDPRQHAGISERLARRQ